MYAERLAKKNTLGTINSSALNQNQELRHTDVIVPKIERREVLLGSEGFPKFVGTRTTIISTGYHVQPIKASVPNYTVRITFGRVRPRTVILRTPLDQTIEIKVFLWTDVRWTKSAMDHKIIRGMIT